MADAVRRPAHYTKGDIEVIEFIEQVIRDYPPDIAHHIGCIIKYVARAPHKGAFQQDLEKAEWYLRRAINISVSLPDNDDAPGLDGAWFDEACPAGQCTCACKDFPLT
jgi:hypothetical protein